MKGGNPTRMMPGKEGKRKASGREREIMIQGKQVKTQRKEENTMHNGKVKQDEYEEQEEEEEDDERR
eukprot:evm.model.NODE_37938_length_5828_cov_20.535175.1